MRSTRRSSACRPTTSTSTSCTATTARRRSTRRLEALDAIVRSGRARYVGVSNFLAYRLARAIGRAELHKLTRFVCVQPRYSLLFREIERELLPLAGEEGLGVIPYNPLAGGLLTGKYQAGAKPRGQLALHARHRRHDVPGPLLERAQLRDASRSCRRSPTKPACRSRRSPSPG